MYFSLVTRLGIAQQQKSQTLRRCPRAVLYFDEIDLLLPTMYRTIVSIIEGRAWDHRANATLPSPAKAAFVFLSGAGGNTLLQMALRKGSVRNAVPMAIAQVCTGFSMCCLPES